MGYIFFEYECKSDKIRFYENSEDRTDIPLVIENLLGSLDNIPQMYPSDAYRLREFAGSLFNSGQVRTVEIRLAMDGGEYRWHLIRAMKVAAREGSRIVGTVNNIHEIKEEAAPFGEGKHRLAYGPLYKGRYPRRSTII